LATVAQIAVLSLYWGGGGARDCASSSMRRSRWLPSGWRLLALRWDRSPRPCGAGTADSGALLELLELFTSQVRIHA
jgi:hypothetical protein